MTARLASPVTALLDRGVDMPHPESVWVAPDVDPERIAPGVVVHPGCRLAGTRLAAGPGCVIGEEAPATVRDCVLAHGVALKGGFFEGAVFLDGASMGSAAHVRPGTLLEEQASGAHAVGFKQTILFPFVTAGSLINFCDILMAGGTSRKNHSEVGSSYIHFNFTPQQDKATASLLGDVADGVFLDRPPIFLGGQGGLVGPRRLAFGTVVPAGTVLRRDVREPGMLAPSEPLRLPEAAPYDPTRVRRLQERVEANLEYLANLRALRAWYDQVRRPRMERDPWRKLAVEAAQDLLDGAWAERMKRLEHLVKLASGQDLAGADADVLSAWPEAARRIRELPEPGAAPDTLLGANPEETDPVRWVHGLAESVRTAGRAWLRALVADVGS